MAAKKRSNARRRRRSPARRRRRSNPYVRASNYGHGGGRRRRSYRRRRRSNPIFPTRMFQSALTLGAGYLAAPMVAQMIPWQPSSRLGQYAKTALGVTAGGMLVSKVFGRKYGNALTAGGWLWIAVDALQSGVTLFGPTAAPGDGVGYYYPPDAELAAGYDVSSFPNGGGSIAAGRLAPRFVN